MKITGKLWMDGRDNLVLVQEDGVSIHVTDTIRRLELWGKDTTIIVGEDTVNIPECKQGS